LEKKWPVRKIIICTGPTTVEQPRQDKNLWYNDPNKPTKEEHLSYVLQ